MTELHIWIYAGLVIAGITAALMWLAIRHEQNRHGISYGLPILFACLPAAIYIGGAGLRIAVFVVLWLLAPLIGGA